MAHNFLFNNLFNPHDTRYNLNCYLSISGPQEIYIVWICLYRGYKNKGSPRQMQHTSVVANNIESFCTHSVFKGKNTFWFSMKFYERLLFSCDSWIPSHSSYLGIYSQMSDDTSRCVSMSATQASYSSAKAPFHLLNVPFVVYCRKAIYPFFRSQYLYTEWLKYWYVGLSN